MNRIPSFVTVCACVFVSVSFAAPSWCDAKSIAKDQVNLRKGPSEKSEILLVAPQGYPIKVIKQSGQWSQFRDWQDNEGWVYSPLVSSINTAVIKVEQANIRAGAGTRFSVVATAALGEIYTILEQKNNWVRLGYYENNASVGWIRNDLVFAE